MFERRPAERAILHVGAPKTGSTFVQSVLWHNRETLATSGVGYPLGEEHEHFAATMDLREMTWGGRRDPAWDGAWDRVAARIRDWPGQTAVFSNELLGGATVPQIKRIVESLRSRRVEVVFTARDLARQLTSDWQEQVKHTHTVTFDDFVDDLVAHGIDAAEPYGPMFWGLHDPVHVLCPWASVVGAEQVHVITVPQAGAPRDTLWRRIAGCLGIDPASCDLDVAANPSLGTVEAELLRAVNERVDRLGRPYRHPLRGRLIDEVLQGRGERAPIAFPDRHVDWVRARSEQLIGGVRAAGYEVVGDLAELRPRLPVAGALDPAQLDEHTLLEAALDVLAGLITRRPDTHN